jgi:cell division septal protein FtsQ
LLIASFAFLLGWSNTFTVKELSYVGAPTKSSQKVVEKLADIEIGDRLARIEVRKVAARIATLAWVEKTKISRTWINGTVRVEVVARTPIATFNGQLVDRSGLRFDLPGGFKNKLPSVFAKDRLSGLAAIGLFRKLPIDFASRTSAFTATSPENIFFNILQDKRTLLVVWGDPGQIDLKLKVYSALVALEENSKIKKIDLSKPNLPIVQ